MNAKAMMELQILITFQVNTLFRQESCYGGYVVDFD